MQTARNDLKNLSNNSFWEQFHYDFLMHSSDIHELSEWTKSAMFVLHLQLFFYSEYQHALEKAENEPIKNNNLIVPLYDGDELRVNLVAITPEKSLPLHDHPGSAGSMLVISGDVRAISCDHTTPVENTNQSRSILEIRENKIISTGNTSCFTQEQNNIHGMEALSERAVLMIIHTPPFAASQQSFFFTADPQQKVGSKLLTQRVRSQAFQHLRKNKQHNIKGIVK